MGLAVDQPFLAPPAPASTRQGLPMCPFPRPYLSASSSTSTRQQRSSNALVDDRWSVSRPGVETTSAVPLRSLAFSALRRSPPMMAQVTSQG
eukprot:scaffold85495_cov32-Tisochrysis_lutea.AAC.2